MNNATLTAGDVARLLRVSYGWVLDKADELGGVHVGHGPDSLRFDPERVVEAVTPRPFRAGARR
jgi:hypothetical protein